ncbi:MAG: PAS domain S-box protein [Bacteroidales bacterium]|nr:PAS domain S-box protein [Bacteroidales bacterium]
MDEGKSLNINNYRDLFYKSPLGIFTATIDGRYIEVNNSFVSLLGYSGRGEMLQLSDISHSVYAVEGEREQLVRLLQKEKQVITRNTHFLKKDHTRLPVRINLSLISQQGGEEYVVGIVEDISSQIRDQKALMREKQTLFTLIENIPDYIYFKDSVGEILIANKSVRDLLEAQRKGISFLKPVETTGLFENDLKLLQNGIQQDERILELNDKTGKKHTISLRKYPVFSNGEISGLIGIGRDISDLKLARDQISESQTNLFALIESSKGFIWSSDKKLKLVISNSAFNNFVREKFKIELKAGMSVTEIFPAKEKEFWKSRYNRCLKGEQLIEEFTVNIDNVAVHFECSFNPILDNSSVTGISVILTDISERKLTEHAIRESEERFRQLAENTSDAFILWDNSGILYANPAFEKIFGVSIEEAMTDSSIIENLIVEPDRQRFIRNRLKETSGSLKPRNQQYLLKRSRRSTRLIWARHFPVYNIKGKVYRYVTVTSDLTEQKQLEEVLTATRSQQQALLDNIPFLAWLKDKNGRYISVNTPFAEYYKQKPDEIIGKTDFDLLPENIAEVQEITDQEIFETGEKKHIEDIRNTGHGKQWFEIYKSPIFNEKGEVIGLTGISREITDRKRLEEAILKNEEHFRALLQHSSDAITILDKNGIITFESSLRNRILNFTVEELVGKPFQEIIHPDDIVIYQEAFKDSLLNPEVQIKKEYRSLHKNKKWIYVESIFSNHLNNPSINGIVINTRDISDRKMSELKEKAYHNNLIFLSNSALELLSISEREDIYKYIAEKLYLFLEQSIILVSAYQEETDCFEIKQVSGMNSFNLPMEEVFGRSPIGFTYKRNVEGEKIENAGTITTVSDILQYIKSPSEILSVLDAINRHTSVNKIYNILLARENKMLGGIIIITLNKTIIKFKHIIETFAHQVSVALHRSQLEYELVSAKLKAEESDRLKTAFLANMSHEIRTPMNGILGFAEMLNDDSLREHDRKKYLDIINSNGKILINLIDDIIDFAKIEAGQINIVKHDFSLNALLNQILNSFLSESLRKERSNVTLSLEKGLNDDNAYIKSDPVRLRQIITNLIGNAFKFTSKGGIEFGYTLKPDNLLEFYVKDTGIGINPDKLTLIFERFVQADSSRSRKYSGSGLGLAISKGLVELLGGKMWAESQVNIGSTFYFVIPYLTAAVKKSETADEKKPKSAYDWSGRKVLIAEDDFFSYKFLEGFIRQTNADVFHADDGSKAVEICSANNDIDIVLMDVQMPEMNGLDATRAIKGFRQKLPIIAQTANAIAEEKQKCFEAGFDDFVTKPINISELFMKMDAWMSGKFK